MPNLLGKDGIARTLTQSLSPDEEEALRKSAGVVRAAIDALKL
jgi:malate/lactate dehydrogenase